MNYLSVIRSLFVISIFYSGRQLFPMQEGVEQLTPAGTTGAWIPLEATAYGKKLGIKIFQVEDKQKAKRDLDIEFLTWMHINEMFHFIQEKYKGKGLPEEWGKPPYSDFLHSLDHIGVYKDSEIKHVVEEAKTKVSSRSPGSPYLIMENFTSQYSCKKKVSADGWKGVLTKFIETNPFVKENDRKEYLEKIVAKIGYVFLQFLFMGVTIEDCDMFVIFNTEYNKEDEGLFRLGAANSENLIKATRIKLIDFGESRIFFTKNNEKIIAVDQNWYNKAPVANNTRAAIENKIKDMEVVFGRTVDVKQYLGELRNRFEDTFNLFTKEFPELKPKVRAQFDSLKRIFGPLRYYDEIEKILGPSSLETSLKVLKSSLEKLKIKLQGLQGKLNGLRAKLIK